MQTDERKPVVGILYPGDMGSSLGKLLADDGFSVVTTVTERSPRTHRLAEQTGLNILPRLADVVRTGNVVVSVVPPQAAEEVAQHYLDLAAEAPPGAIYIDANPICPQALEGMALRFARAQIQFVDGAIHGVAAQLRGLGSLYLSGAKADALARLFGRSLRVKYLGDQPGRASAFKMLLGGMSKGLIALFVEMAAVARSVGLSDDMLDCYGHFYPGVMTAVERILPTYPQHAARRADEMGELEQMMSALGLTPRMVGGAHRVIDALAQHDWKANPRKRTVAEIIEEVHSRCLLTNMPADGPAGLCSFSLHKSTQEQGV
jgi:3-hydroxyisobutyrate dehydrogenase-like beta-hydroxyacid dehydrogenase